MNKIHEKVSEDMPQEESYSAKPLLAEISRLKDRLSLKYAQSAEWEIKEFFRVFTGKTPVDLIMENIIPGRMEISRIRDAVEKRLQDTPLAYITNEVEFMGKTVFVNEHTFIPRVETEILVREAIAVARIRFRSAKSPFAVDLGSGSGCIAVSFADRLPEWNVNAIELSHASVLAATRNVESFGLSNRVNVIHQDYFQIPWLDYLGRKPHLVLANPPYIAASDFDKLPQEVRKEPYQALIGGAVGVEIPQRILLLAKDRLAERGVVMMEIGAGQMDNFRKMCSSIGLRFLRAVTDHNGHERVLIAENLGG